MTEPAALRNLHHIRVRRSLLLATLAVAALGCVRPDWVGSTLVTVDVSGDWTGTWTQGTSFRGALEMKLAQRGAKVTGTVQFYPDRPSGPRVLEGTVSGDTLRLAENAGGFTGELTVGFDEMTGLLAGRSFAGSRISLILRRK
jgi:hypothetical protein